MENLIYSIIGYIYQSYQFLIVSLSHKEVFTGMEVLSILLVTLFVPLAFFLIEDQNGPLWDRKVILQYVIRPCRVIAFIAFFIFSFFLWGIQVIRPALFLIYGTSLFFIIKIAKDSYNWLIETNKSSLGTGGFKNTLRENFLKKTGNWTEKGEIWQDAWSQDLKLPADQWLLPVFIDNVDKLLEIKNYTVACEYLSVFNHFLLKRPLFHASFYSTLLKKLFIWHEQLYIALEDDNSLCVQETIKELIEGCFVFALKKHSGLFFDNLKYHSDGKEQAYLEELFGYFICGTFFNHVGESPERIAIWGNESVNGCFPSSWKITKETIEDEKNYIKKIWFSHFCYFAQPRIDNQKQAEFHDKNLEEVSSKLFPTTEPFTWAFLLSFLFTKHWESGCRMQSLINKPKTFGFSGRSYHTTWESGISIEGKRKTYLDNTYELALIIFENGLSKNELEKYLNEVN